jgi:predicted RNase H-like HicB family nuclease
VASLTEYQRAAMRNALYEQLEEGGWYAHIPGLPGLWASAPTVEDTRNELLSALEDWLYVNSYISHLELPAFDGVTIGGSPPRTAE